MEFINVHEHLILHSLGIISFLIGFAGWANAYLVCKILANSKTAEEFEYLWAINLGSAILCVILSFVISFATGLSVLLIAFGIFILLRQCDMI